MVNRVKRYSLLITIVAFVACGKNSGSNRMIFHYNEMTGIASLDPAFAKNQSTMWPAHQLFNTLIETDDSLRLKPSLATHWEISPDKLTFTFHLRNDVFFHDDECFANGKGRKLKAADVVYSFNRILDRSVASPGGWIFNRKVDSIQPFMAIDDSTFQLKLLKPYQPILGILSMQYCSIVAREAVQKYGNEFRRHPVGTGPFAFVAWEEGQALVLKKNDNYFEKDEEGKQLPYLDGIKVSFYDSKATEFLLFRQKKLQFLNDIDASFKDEILTRQGSLRAEWKDKIVLQVSPYLNTEYFGMLVDTASAMVKQSPLQNKKIRQAINYGFDRRKMVLYLRNSLGAAAESGFVPEGLPSFNADTVKGYHYDPGMSRKLLKEAGYENGKGLKPVKLLSIALYADMASFVARQLEEIGIPIQVEIVQKALLLEMTANQTALFFRGSWIADYPDAENYLSVFYSKNPAPPNYTRYKNPVFDKLFEQALVEENDEKRYQLYRQADQVLINDAPVVPLWYDRAVHFSQPEVKGFHPNGLNMLELRRTSIQK